MIVFNCHHCGKRAEKLAGCVNRSRAIGAPLYCDKVCAGLARRKHKTKAQKVVEKKAYDAEYRVKNRAILKAKKRAYHQRTYDPVKAAAHRKTRMPYHVEYCRQPEYKAKKREYDAQLRAREYGPFADAYRTLVTLQHEILSRASRYEIDLAKGTLNKKLRRRREDAAFRC